MTDPQLLWLIIVTIVGSVVCSLLGWADSGGAFDIRKFLPSMIRAAVAAIVVGLGTIFTYNGPVTLMIYLLAFLSGMGIDAVGNRISGAITGSSQENASQSVQSTPVPLKPLPSSKS